MSFAHPAALFLAALALPIVIFYILKIRLRRVPVSTVMFWQQIFEEKQPRSIWQTLRHLLSLLVQLLFLALLVFALAEPFFHWETLAARRIVLVVDNSASMNATDAAPNRLAAAKELGKQVISGLRFRDELAIVAAGTEAHVQCGMSGHERTLLAALESVRPTDGPTCIAEGVALARRLLGGQKNAQIVVLSDGCFERAAELAGELDLQFRRVGARTGNVGITRFQVRRSLLDPTGYQILLEVSNASDEPVECRLDLELNDDIVDVLPLKLEPGGRWSQTLDKVSTDGGRLHGRLDRADALAADNEAWALLPKRELQPVLLVSERNLFLEKVLEANPLVQLKSVKELPDPVPRGTVVFLHRQVPATLPAGSVFVVDPETGCDQWELGDKLDNPIVTKQDADSLLMSHVRLDNVLLPQARKLTFPGHSKVLASAVTNDPLYAALERPSGKVLVLTVNLDQGDLPLRTAFPILVTNALGWFAGAAGELRESLAAGATANVTLPATPLPPLASEDAASRVPPALELVSPDGAVRPLPTAGSLATVGPLDRCGIWRISAVSKDRAPAPAGESPAVLELACNLASRGESDLRPPEVTAAPQASVPSAAGFLNRPIWYYLLVLAWVLAVGEWYLYQRRWIS